MIFQNIALSTLRDVPAFDDRTQRNLRAFGSSGTKCLEKI